MKAGTLQSAASWVDSNPLLVRSDAPAAPSAAVETPAAAGLLPSAAADCDADVDADVGDDECEQAGALTSSQQQQQMLPDTITHQVRWGGSGGSGGEELHCDWQEH